MEGCNIVEKEDIQEKESQVLQWQEGTGSSLPRAVRSGQVGRTEMWKRG